MKPSDFLTRFILQAQGSNLKSADYPKEFSNLKMKVSFGMGMPARVPWISFTVPGISTSNGYYPVYLYYKEQNIVVLSYGISETSEYPVNWTKEIQENNRKINDIVPNPARYGDSYVYTMYSPEIKGESVTFTKNGVVLSDREI
jgi:5-methylcytosine-specific restriction enzyme B